MQFTAHSARSSEQSPYTHPTILLNGGFSLALHDRKIHPPRVGMPRSPSMSTARLDACAPQAQHALAIALPGSAQIGLYRRRDLHAASYTRRGPTPPPLPPLLSRAVSPGYVRRSEAAHFRTFGHGVRDYIWASVITPPRRAAEQSTVIFKKAYTDTPHCNPRDILFYGSHPPTLHTPWASDEPSTQKTLNA